MRTLTGSALGLAMSVASASGQGTPFYARANAVDGSIDIVSASAPLVIGDVTVNRGNCRVLHTDDDIFALDMARELEANGVTGEDFEKQLRDGIAAYKKNKKPYKVEFGDTLHLLTSKGEGRKCTVLEIVVEANGRKYTFSFKPR